MKVELTVNGERRLTGRLARVTFISEILIQLNHGYTKSILFCTNKQDLNCSNNDYNGANSV
jgi:hypothetical protein